MTEPAEWENYDKSSLPNFLRHDSWNRHDALSLLSGIDPRESEPFRPLLYYDIPHDEVYEFSAHLDGDETIDYWKIQLLADPPNSARRTWYENIDDYQAAEDDWNTMHEQFPEIPNSKTLDELLKDRFAAKRALDEIVDIFDSAPEHGVDSAFPPNKYIGWAKSKNLEIPWLKWAEARNLIELRHHDLTSGQIPLDKRERDTLHTIIGALLSELDVDPNQHGVIKRIVGFTEDYDAPIGKTKIGEILRAIPASKESVQDRKRQ